MTDSRRAVRAAAFLARAAAVFCGTLAVLFVLLLAAYALPGEPVRKNAARSAETIRQEGLYPEYFGFKLFQMDNYTDTIMLFEASTADETDPLTAMMTNTAYNVDNFSTLGEDLSSYLAARQAGQSAPGLVPFSYARYWHGYLIWLRPLLLVMPYAGVRVVQYLVLALLGALVVLRLAKCCARRAAVWFALSQALVAVWFVPRQVQFFTCFLVAYAGCLWVLAKPRGGGALALGLLAVGVCTAFCDLLVTPILTLGLPTCSWLLSPGAAEKKPAANCGAVLGGSVCWGTGYVGCWGAKWVIAGAVTGADVVGDALHQAGVRTTGAAWHGMELSWGNIAGYVYDTLAARGLFWPAVAAAVLLAAWVCLCIKGRTALFAAAPLALCVLMAPAWFCLLRTHSIQHGWFTWRALSVSAFAAAAFWHTACSARVGAARLRGRGKQPPA